MKQEISNTTHARLMLHGVSNASSSSHSRSASMMRCRNWSPAAMSRSSRKVSRPYALKCASTWRATQVSVEEWEMNTLATSAPSYKSFRPADPAAGFASGGAETTTIRRR